MAKQPEKPSPSATSSGQSTDSETTGAAGQTSQPTQQGVPAGDQKSAAPSQAANDKQSQAAEAKQPSAIDLLKQDHRKVEQLFQQYEKASEDEEKRRLLGQIASEFLTHSRIEEEIFYPACKGKVQDDLLNEAQVEHDGAKQLLIQLRDGFGGDPFTDAKVKVLSEYVKHHVGEEEKAGSGIFAAAQKAGVDVAALGQQITEQREEIAREVEAEPNPPMPSLQRQKGSRVKEYAMAQQDYQERGRSRSSSRYDDDDNRGRRTPPRDEEGRFMSDDRGRGREREDDDRRSSYARSGGGGRYDDDDRGGGGGGRGQGGWFGDSEGHSEASRRGWDNPDHGPSGWYGDSRGHSEASRRGWDNPRHGDSGWYGDPEGHSEASRRGWEDRSDRGRSSSSRDDDDRRGGGNGGGNRSRDEDGRFTSRGRGDDDDRRGGGGGGNRSRDDDGRFTSRGRDDDDDRRGYSSRSRDDDDDRGRGRGGWFGDPEGHSEASRRGWQNR
ncbi:MAG: hemerythrin domain-containing protein [Sphingobium sp.]|nr:hemerythrin domain-containing protein [Sphingobium sp.]